MKRTSSHAQDEIALYHQSSKHDPGRYAPGPAGLDWANQPDPFRRFVGAPATPLVRDVDLGGSLVSRLDRAGEPKASLVTVGEGAGLNWRSLSSFFYNSLAISAWKRSGASTWALRVNPSSGNLHPTEGYLMTGSIEGLNAAPSIFHYAPDEHALEIRARLPEGSWEGLGLPAGSFLLVMTSIYWRESWKYGLRAYRYCALDAGHALSAAAISASCHGWQAGLVDDPGTDEMREILGLDTGGPEAESPEFLLAIHTDGDIHDVSLSSQALSRLVPPAFEGEPNILSVNHESWPGIGWASEASRKPHTGLTHYTDRLEAPSRGSLPAEDICGQIRERRSAQAFDGETYMDAEDFFEMLSWTLPGRVPFTSLPWGPYAHIALFVHRVRGLSRGLYFLVRDPRKKDEVSDLLSPEFLWERPAGAPDDLSLYLLAEGDARALFRHASCNQEIASDGCFGAAMISEFKRPLERFGPWFYPRLHWECGMIGQMLYLGAGAKGVRGCGMGCFFDDAVHRLLGIKDMALQDLYHFGVGKAVNDPRLTTLPAYS